MPASPAMRDIVRRLVSHVPLVVQVFALFFMIYVITAPGGYEVSDAVVRYETAKSWVEGRGGELASAAPPAVSAPDGRAFSVYGPMQSLLMVPGILLSKTISHGSPDTTFKLLFGIIGIPLISALSMALLFRSLRLFGYSEKIALWSTVVVGLATPMWHYARSGQEENIVGLGFSIYLCGVAMLFVRSYGGLSVLALGTCVVVATRTVYVPAVTFMLLPVAVFLLHRRSDWRAWMPMLLAGTALGLATCGGLLWYNYHRFASPFETGYGIYHRRIHESFFDFPNAPANVAALLVSPYRGLLWFCPTVVVLLGLRTAAHGDVVRRLGPYIGGAWVFTLIFVGCFRFWSAGFAWGPRYVTALMVLLAPLLAAVFASGQRWTAVIIVSMVIQFCSVALPASAENYVYAMREGTSAPCTAWSCECTAACLRGPWVLRALENTARGTPLPTLDADEAASASPDAERILESSDYASVYWWPVRAAYRAHKLPAPVALGACLAVLAGAAYALWALCRTRSSTFVKTELDGRP